MVPKAAVRWHKWSTEVEFESMESSFDTLPGAGAVEWQVLKADFKRLPSKAADKTLCSTSENKGRLEIGK